MRRIGIAVVLGCMVAAFCVTGSVQAADSFSRGAVRTDADVLPFGAAPGFGAPDGKALAGIVGTASGNGYWIAGANGTVYQYGDAAVFGSLKNLNRPIVGIARTVSGNGYWLVASDGGIFTSGDAQFYGSTGSLKLKQPVVGMAATPSGKGYWLVAADGGIFSFGDTQFYGSTGALVLNQPVVGMTPTTTGRGYRMVARDGGMFSFGDAEFFGSAVGVARREVVAMTASTSGNGYRMLAADGGIFTFGDALFHGSGVGAMQNDAVAMASRDNGYWILAGPPKVSPSARSATAPPSPAVLGQKAAVYSNSQQRVWLVEYDGTVVDSYAVSGRQGMPGAGFYHVQRKLPVGRSGSLALDLFVGFAYGPDSDIGFHVIPRTPGGAYIQSEAELGQFRSHGCVRQARADARIMWDFSYVGMLVVVTP